MSRTVLLIHGMSSSSRTWWRVGPSLAELGWDVVTVDLAGHRVVARFAGRNALRPGDMVDITVDPTRAHVFDVGTGQALFHPAAEPAPRADPGT